MIQKTTDQWLDEYGVSHQNSINKLIHWFCVPLIYLDILGLVWALPTPSFMADIAWLNWGSIGSLLVVAFYIRLSPSLAIGLTLFNFLCCALLVAYDAYVTFPLWITCVVAFVVLWVLQFIGHHIEGAKPSFFKDLQFLLIGPAWLMGFIYRRMRIPYS